MRFLLTAILAVSFPSVASASVAFPGSFLPGTLYNLNIGPVTDVGNGLVSVIVSIENISGNPDFDVNSITDAQFGMASGLHHDFVFGAVTTPLGRSTDPFGLSASTVDSHFLPDGQEASPVLTAPTESGPLVNVGAPTQLTNGSTGIGSGISGQFGFPSSQVVNLARLVFPTDFLLSGIDFGFSVADADVGSQGERFEGCIGYLETICVPEPTTAALALLGMVGVAACRQRP